MDVSITGINYIVLLHAIRNKNKTSGVARMRVVAMPLSKTVLIEYFLQNHRLLLLLRIFRHSLPSQEVVNKSNVLWDSAPYKIELSPFTA